MVTTKLLTADDLWLMQDDGFKYELIRGELKRMSPAGRKHGAIGMNFGSRITYHVADNALGETYNADTGFVIATNPDVVLAPDVAFVRSARLIDVDEDSYLPFPPDLAVEIVSPSDRPAEVAEKVAAYLEAGVPLVWVLWPRTATIVVHRPGRDPTVLGADDVLDGGDVLPGFRLRVGELLR